MSAICGIYTRGEKGGADGLDNMLAALSDYGACKAQWNQGWVGLGGRHSAPAASSEQPPSREGEAPMTITADARLDDRANLGSALGLSHRESNHFPDDELILRAYRRWGRDCPKHLLGDYAFAIWDSQRRRLFCARDPMGVRPCYYYLTAARFSFASDIKGVLADPCVPDRLDEAYAAAILMRQRSLSPARTFFQAVRKLPPGHTLTVSRGRTRLSRYWRPEDVPPVHHGSDDEYADAFLALYAQTIKDCLRGVHSVGVHLSGGLDSSSIAVLTARELRRQGRPPPLAFCWHPPPDKQQSAMDEYVAIESICAQENLQPLYHAMRPEAIVTALRHDGSLLPDVGGTLLHEELVQRRAAENGVGIMLSGWGGDQGVSFNGADYFSRLLCGGHLKALVEMSRAIGTNPLKLTLTKALVPMLHVDAVRIADRLRHGRWSFRRRASFIHQAYARPGARGHPLELIAVRRQQRWLLRSGDLSERIENWAARGVRHGIVYRYPLLDRRLLEFALGLPPEQFWRGGRGRWLMRYALQSIAPYNVCWELGKRDPARYNPLIEAVAQALPTIRQSLDGRARPPRRVRYFDMPNLLDALDADALRRNPKLLGPIRTALQFLDF